MGSVLKTVIVDSDPVSRAALRRSLASAPSMVVIGEFDDIAGAIRATVSQVPDVLIVEVPAEPSSTIAEAARALPDTAIVATASNPSADFALRAIRAGALECLRRPVERGELLAALDKLARVRRTGPPPRRASRVTSIFSTKGGLGVTTLAVNLAVCMAARARTLLLELHTSQSDITTLLNLRPRFSVLDALENVERMDESFLQGLLVKHGSGLWVLPGPSRIERGHIGGNQVRGALEVIRAHFDEVVVDLRHDLDPGTLAALEASDRVLFVTGLDVATLRSGAAGLAAFRHLGVDLQKIKAVVMREGTGEDVTLRHAREALGIPIYWKTPSDYQAVVASINDGRPVVTASPRSKVARNFHDLAETLRTVPEAAAKASNGAPSLRTAWIPKKLFGAG
jgi:pilus assembly protein CpaE